MKRSKLTLTNDQNPDEEGQEKGQAYDDDDEEEEENENLDQFETDGFVVDYEEEENNDQAGKDKQKKEKKRKKRSVKDLVLDDDDIELLQENRISGICQFPNERKKFKRLKKAGKSTKVVEQSGVSGDEGLLFGDIFGKEEAAYDMEEYEMANFIVDDAESYRERSPLRRLKNLKKLEQVVTICSSAQNDVGPITVVANEIRNHQKQALAINVKLEGSSEFEPFFLADKYMTERDNHVRVTDMPERMQVIEEIDGPLPLDEMSREESAWILNQLVMDSYLLFCKQRTPERSEEGSILLSKIKKEDIKKFLELHHVEKYDIPFIAMYRKEQCPSLLDDIEQDEAAKEDNDDVEQACQLKWHKVLWVIKQLDTKWLLLQKRKSALQMYQKKRYEEKCLNIDSSERLTLNKQLFESISKSLNKAESKEEIDDVDTKFGLHFPSVEERIDGNFKRPIRKSQYSNCMKAGLWKLACWFGCTSEQLGLQIALEEMDVEFQGYPDESPDEMALNFTCALFETPELVLKGARHMAALEMSCEPCIKKHIRSIFMDKAVVTTSPTLEGNVIIDYFHQFAGVKWLHEKPLSKFNDAQWLLIQKAEEEKLLKVSIKLLESMLNKLIAGFNDVYLINGAGRSAHLWKEQCKLILHDAFFNFLLPSMEKEARNLLTCRAKHWLLMEYGKELWKMISVGPYSTKKNIAGSAESVAPKVISCCQGSGKPATTFVMLDSSGELLDVLEARSFNLRSETIDDQQRKKNDWQRVFRFMKKHQPHVIVIGAANASCLRLKEDVKEIVSKLEENLRDLGQAMNEISVVFGDESLPQLYEHSEISSDQLPGQPGIVKRAVALGRYLQNPLAMVATLCGTNREIVSWKLCSFEHFLTPDEKFELIEQVMVDVTNQVGFDVNFAVSHDWYFPLLQFISGLGPQKSYILQRKIVAYSAVNNRKELANFGLNTKKVFHNAVGFLCIRGGQLPCTSFEIDLLDCTRIHPESYELAERLAKAVCSDTTEAPIEYVKKEPQVLSAFDINDYLENNEIGEGENRRETLNHIKMELLHGFLDPRKPYKVPSLDEEFNMICGENRIALAEGRPVQAVVRHVQSERAFCVLDSGLTGIIMKDDFSDRDDEFSLEEKLHEGDKVSCMIKQIDKTRCQAFLTCKASERKRSRYEDINEVDPYYHEGASILLNQQEKACLDEKLGKKHFKPRIIIHPCFRNMTMDQAMEFLSDKDAGESIFRPSSRGPSYLTLTLKVFDELYVNKDIVESGKDGKDIMSLLHIGKTLKIGDYTFGDLDEVMDRYVVPLVKHLKEILGFQKFKRGSKAEVDEVLRAEKSEYPMRIVYYFGVSYEHPGTFILSYIRSRNLHHEYVGLLPNGFKFRKRTFEKIEQLVGFFQKNIDDLQHKSPTLVNPEIGNSSAACTGGGWLGQVNNSVDRSISRGRNGRDGNEDREKRHPSGIPRPQNGPRHVSSNDAAKWGNDTDFAPHNGGSPGGWSSGADASGGNWDTNEGIRNSEWSKESGNNGPSGVSASDWAGTKNGGSGGNNGVWHASGNTACGRGHRGGECDHGPGSGGGCSSSWGDTKEGQNGGNFGSSEGVWHAARNNVGGRGLGGGTHGWGSNKESENSGYFDSDEGVWHAAGNSGGRGHMGGVREHGPGGGYGGSTGSGDSHRGVGRGSARNGRSSGRGRGHSNERVDNSCKESEFGRNFSNWGSNEDRKWSLDKKRDFPGDGTYGSWGRNNVSGSSWKHCEGGGNGDSGGWDNANNNSRPESWGGHVAVNRGGWSSGSQEIVNTGWCGSSSNSRNLGGGGNDGW